MKTAVVVMQSSQDEMWLKGAIVLVYDGAVDLNRILPIPGDVVVEHVAIPAEFQNLQIPNTLASVIAEDGSVGFKIEVIGA